MHNRWSVAGNWLHVAPKQLPPQANYLLDPRNWLPRFGYRLRRMGNQLPLSNNQLPRLCNGLPVRNNGLVKMYD